MIRFKKFLKKKEEKKEKIVILDTIFGSHAIKKVLKPLETVFGRHSQKPEKKIDEAYAAKKPLLSRNQFNPLDNIKHLVDDSPPSVQTSKTSYADKKTFPPQPYSVSPPTGAGTDTIFDHDVEGTDENHPSHSKDADKYHAFAEHYSKYDGDDISTIQKYTNTSYDMNKHLFKSHVLGVNPIGTKGFDYEHEGEVKDRDEHIQAMDKMVNVHRTPHHMVVYTGMKIDPQKAYFGSDNPENSVVAHHPAFMSTSTSKNKAIAFARQLPHQKIKDSEGNESEIIHQHVLKIHVPVDRPGAYVAHRAHKPSYSGTSGYAHEREFILPRNSKIRIHPNPEITNHKGYMENKIVRHVWTGHLLGPHDEKKEE